MLATDAQDPIAKKMAEVDGNDSLVKEAETSTDRLPLNISDDEPLSTWFEALKNIDATSKLVYILKALAHMYCNYF